MGELVVTNKGKELITKLIEGSETINFTRIKTSIHDYSSDNLEDLTDIEEVRQESMISSVEKTDNTVVEVIAMINNNALQEGYYIKTIGLYAKDSNDNEILYGVSIAGKYADYMPAYGGKTVSSISYKLITKVDNAEQVNIEINPAAIPTITQINELKQVVIEFKDLTDEHIKSHIISQEGSHGLKYDEDESKLKYKKNGVWEDIPTGQQAETKINEHKEKSILNEEGAHDFKYDESSQKFKYKKDGTWNDINTSGNTQGLEEHKEKSILNEEGIHDFKYNKSQHEFQYKENDTWNNIDITSKHRGARVIGGDGVHGIKFDTSDKKLKYKDNSNNWENVPTGQDEIEEHAIGKINSEEGMHGLRYHDNKLQHYNKDSQSWENVTQDVLVTGLTASVLKVGTTAVIKTESEELKRVTGTFTNDANAVASDIISGKTAYVNGNKVTGNIATRTGTISISNPSISGNNLVTPTIPNGYYNNSKISFNRNNLYPESIKAGTNLYGVTGTFTNDATATASDIVSGKTAYVNGNKITGTLNGRPLASISGVGRFLGGTEYTIEMLIRSIDSTFISSSSTYYTSNNTNQSSTYIYFRRNARIVAYGYGNNYLITLPWGGQSGTYTKNYNITTSSFIRVDPAFNQTSSFMTVLICEVG